MGEIVIEISSREEFIEIKDNSQRTFELTDDIYLKEEDFSNHDNQIRSFKGVIDGQGHEIRNFGTIKSNQSLWDGLIRKNAGIIKNLHVDADIKSDGEIGVICNKNHGSIIGCSVEGNLKGKGNSKGGIATKNMGEIIDCEFDGTIIECSASSAGGIAGVNASLIKNCHSSGGIKGNYKLGGITGNNSGRVLSSSSQSNINNVDTADSIGGLVGKNFKTIRDSYYFGNYNIEKHLEKNGVIAGLNSGKLINCYCSKNKYDKTPVELIGIDSPGEITKVGIKPSIKKIEKAILVGKI